MNVSLNSKRLLVRASIGTLAVLGLVDIKMNALPTTAYILEYSKQGCMASCMFCSQSSLSKAKDKVSRITWPIIDFSQITYRLRRNSIVKRICVQSIIKPFFRNELLKILRELSIEANKPISLSVNIVEKHWLKQYHRYSDKVGVGLDVASPRVLKYIRKPGSWSSYFKFIDKCLEIYGKGNVYVHLIIGLGEKDSEVVKVMEKLYSMGCNVALFAFTPIKGTPLESWNPPSIYRYRIFQLIRQLLHEGYDIESIVLFNEDRIVGLRRGSWMRDEELLLSSVLTSGCPYCNRPFYNESPKGPLYNYPTLELVKREREKILSQIYKVII